MMFQGLVKRRRLLSGAISAVLVASAYQAGGCTINVDENLLQQLQGLVGNVQVSGLHDGPRMGPPRDCSNQCDNQGAPGDNQTQQ